MNKSFPAEISGDFDIGYLSETGFGSYGMHRHKYCELLFVLGGDLNFLVEDKAYHFSGSSMIFFRENRLHTTEINKDVNYERYNLYFKQKYISELMDYCLIREVYDNDCLVIPLSDAEKAEMLFYFEKMNELNAKAEKSDMESSLLVHLLCSVLLRTATLVHEKFVPEKFSTGGYIDGVLSYINSNVAEKLIIEDIAQRFFVSRAKLIADFKKATGVTVGEYVLARRIRFAKKLIKEGMKIGDVAEKSGFNNACHFIRTFKKETGLTPLQYRNGKPSGGNL